MSYFFIVSAPSGASLEEEDEVSDVVGHLRSGGRSAVFVVDETVFELTGHTDDHMVEITGIGYRGTG